MCRGARGWRGGAWLGAGGEESGPFFFPPPSSPHLAGPPLARGPLTSPSGPPQPPVLLRPLSSFTGAATTTAAQAPAAAASPSMAAAPAGCIVGADLTPCRRPAASAARRHGGRDRR